MFTGIVDEIGLFEKRIRTKNKYQLLIKGKNVLPLLKKGYSIAVNGVCLSVVTISSESFSADVMPETLEKTNLKNIKIGSKINLELPVKANDFLGGHIISGHIDGICKLKKIEQKNNARILEFDLDSDLSPYMVEKGSVALNGVSLTLFNVSKNAFKVSLIPETLQSTNLNDIKIGDVINIETDILGKYVFKMMQMKENNNKNTGLDKNYLKENGFI